MHKNNKELPMSEVEKNIKRKKGDRLYNISGTILAIAGFVVICIIPPTDTELLMPLHYIRLIELILIILYIAWMVKWIKHFKSFILMSKCHT